MEQTEDGNICTPLSVSGDINNQNNDNDNDDDYTNIKATSCKQLKKEKKKIKITSQVEEKNETKGHNYDLEMHNLNTPVLSRQETLNQEKNTSITYFPNIHLRVHVSRCLNDFYKKRMLPNFNDVYNAVKHVIPGITVSSFQQYMTLSGYAYRTMPSGNLLMEDPIMAFERFFYLNNIIKIRQMNKQDIYYVDHRVVDTTLTFQKPPLHNFDDSFQSSNDTVFLYIISAQTGRVNGVFTNYVDFDVFKKWISGVVLDVLNHRSVVVMNENFKQTVTKPEITMYDTKNVMLKWLKSNGIPCTNNMRKAELFELYKKTPKENKITDAKAILEARGHNVLYLPNHLSDLSPTNYHWNKIQNILSTENKDTLKGRNSEGVNNLISRITCFLIPIIASNLTEFDKTIIQKEKEIFDLDAEIERSLDELMDLKL